MTDLEWQELRLAAACGLSRAARSPFQGGRKALPIQPAHQVTGKSVTNHQPSVAPLKLCLAVAACTLATLLLELSLTRIFSVVLYYHFAFVAISLALFGLGAGGILGYYLPARFRAWKFLGQVCVVNGLLVVVVLLIVLRQSLIPQMLLMIAYPLCAVPFLAAGLVVSVIIAKSIEQVGRVYFYDLVGAALGCLLLVPLLDRVGGPGTVITAGAFFAFAGALLLSLDRLRFRVFVSALTGVLLLILAIASSLFIDISHAKGKPVSGTDYSKWNSFSRVSVSPQSGSRGPLILIDSDAGTEIARCPAGTESEKTRDIYLGEGPGLPYAVRPGAKTLVIGAGGGVDVCRALISGSVDVAAVEINPIIARDVMMDEYVEASEGLYLRPEVRVVVEDGRSFIRRTEECFGVIQMTLVDSWASTAAGAFALAENHLYTVEAFRDYLSHLTPDGVFAITRWEFAQPRESLRIVSLAQAALHDLGQTNPSRHIVIGRDQVDSLDGEATKDTVLIKRSPFAPEELQRLRTAMDEAGIGAVYVPDRQLDNPFAELLESSDPNLYAANYPFDISPTTDNRPFFFYTWRPERLRDFFLFPFTLDAKTNLGIFLLFVSLGLAVAAMALILALPRVFLRQRIPRDQGLWTQLFYFFAIGLGFILVEIAFVQRIALYLGQPTYALTVVIFSLLLASGCGSYLSRPWIGTDTSRLAALLFVIAAAVSLLITVTPALLDASLGYPLGAKLALVAGVLFPVGFLMGMPFPTGLRLLEQSHPRAVCWAWAVNAGASVLGSVLAVFVAIYAGLAQTVLLGGLLYCGALVAVLRATKTAWERETTPAGKPSSNAVSRAAGAS